MTELVVQQFLVSIIGLKQINSSAKSSNLNAFQEKRQSIRSEIALATFSNIMYKQELIPNKNQKIWDLSIEKF